MLGQPGPIRLLVALMLASVTVSASSAAAVEAPSPDHIGEIEALKADNAAVRELLRKMEEQQKALLEQVDRLQRRLDGAPTAAAPPAAQPQMGAVPGPPAPDASASGPTTGAAAPSTQQASGEPAKEDRYQDGMVIWQNAEDAKVPFLPRFNVNTQIRYLNTTDSPDSFTDHLGVVRAVNQRNDITVNRVMFILAGYVFNPKLQYSFTIWTSAGAASIVVAGNVGWRFNKGLTLTGGHTGVPGSRSLVSTFPFFQPTDRSMADNFFRPGFTQGLWASGEPLKGLSYLAFVGNGLNTLNLSANKIDENGFDLSTGYFVVPKKLAVYVRGSKVFGQFYSPYEYAGGLKLYPLPTERWWLTGELARVHRAPYSGAFTPYTAGIHGWVPMVQTVLAS